MLIDSMEKVDVATFDPFGLDFRSNPKKYFDALLAASPIFITMAGKPSAVVAKYAQVAAMLRDFKAFSSLKPAGIPGMERVDFFNGLPVMNYSNPPEHTRRRKVINAAFTPKRVEPLSIAADKLIDEALDRLEASGTIDAVGELTKRLALTTLLDNFLSIPKEEQHIFIEYVESWPLFDTLKPGDPKPAPFIAAFDQAVAYCKEQLALAREGKCTNLIGTIAASHEEGAIDEYEMTAMMIVLLVGGLNTVAGSAGSSLCQMALNPETSSRIRRDPALASNHLEETLRFDSPVPVMMRFGKPGSQVDGHAIADDMPVYVMLSTANRDPDVFPDPHRFDIDRPNAKDHVAFGQGIHTCIGNAITRTLVTLLIRKVAQRFDRLNLADVPDAVRYDLSNVRTRHLEYLRVEVERAKQR